MVLPFQAFTQMKQIIMTGICEKIQAFLVHLWEVPGAMILSTPMVNSTAVEYLSCFRIVSNIVILVFCFRMHSDLLDPLRQQYSEHRLGV